MVISSPSDGSAGSHRLLVERAVARFRKAFGAEPTHVAFAPGRVNLIGDHTDYAGGLVFPAALEEGCVCALAPADGVFAAVSDDLDGEVAVVDASGRFTPHDLTGSPSWMRYAAGTFEIMRRRFAPDAGGARLAVASDVPAGGGLSSSAALEVSIATALEAMWSLDIDPVAKAEACQQAEHTFAGAPCGLMDQLVSVVGAYRAGDPDRLRSRDPSGGPVAASGSRVVRPLR
jgi:galactokinase